MFIITPPTTGSQRLGVFTARQFTTDRARPTTDFTAESARARRGARATVTPPKKAGERRVDQTGEVDVRAGIRYGFSPSNRYSISAICSGEKSRRFAPRAPRVTAAL